MIITLTTPTWPANIVVIDDGDVCSNAEHGATAQNIANALAWLKQWAPDELILNVPLLPTQNSSTRFTLVHTNTSIAYYSQTDVTSAGRLGFTLPPLPSGRKIKKVVAAWRNVNGAALPATMPTVALYRTVNSATPVDSTIGTQADTASPLAAYQAIHAITLNVDELIAVDNQYGIAFTGEASTNSANGGQLVAVRVHVQAT